MPHVRVQRLGAGQRQHHRAQRDESEPTMLDQEDKCGKRVQRRQDARRLLNVERADDSQYHEPEHHDGPEDRTDARGPAFLHDEEPDEDRERDRHDVRLELRGRNLQALDRTEHRNGRRDHAVPVEKRSAEHTDDQQPMAKPGPVRHRRGSQRE